MEQGQVKIERKNNRPRVAIFFDHKKHPTRTKQEFKKECDINQIMKRAKLAGGLPPADPSTLQYGDARGYDFHAAMNLITEAQQRFEGLPASIRNEFANDPARFLDFVQDNTNEERAREMGLIPPKKVEQTQPAQPTDNQVPTPPVTSSQVPPGAPEELQD